MFRLSIILLILCTSAYSGCSEDPFASGCDNVNSNALDVASDIVCNNGYKISSNGDVKDSSGNQVTNIGSISTAAKTLSACDNYGGAAAVGKQNNNIQVQLNTNNVTSAAAASAASSSGSAAAGSSGSSGDSELEVTTTGGTTGTDGGGASEDPNYWRGTTDPPGSCCNCSQCLVTCPVPNPTTSGSWASWSAANCGGSTGGSTDGSTGGSGVTCDPGIEKYKDVDKCCPASYPSTGTETGCCKNATGQEVCI